MAEGDVYGLNEQSVRTLKRMASDWRTGQANWQGRESYSKPTAERGFVWAKLYENLAPFDDGEPGKAQAKIIRHTIEETDPSQLSVTDELVDVFNGFDVAYAVDEWVQIEREAKNGRWFVVDNPSTRIAKTTSVITAGPSPMGSGTAEIYVANGGVLTETNYELTIYNPTTQAIGENEWVTICKANGSWVIVAGSGLVRFELTADLELGGEGPAKVCVIDGSDWFATTTIITVIDPYDPGAWQGKTGYQGFCVARPPDKDSGISDGKYDVVYMEEQAVFIEFEALEDRDPASDSFEAKLEYWYQGREPSTTAVDPEDAEAGRKLTVYDTQKIFPHILKTGKGKAVWDDINKVYETYIAQQRGIYGGALVSQDFCVDDVSVSIDYNTFFVESPSPFNLEPETKPTTLLNPLKLAGLSGSEVRWEWWEQTGEFVITQVEHAEEDLVIDVYLDGSCIKQKKKTYAVMKCSNEEIIDTVICISDCTTGGA